MLIHTCHRTLATLYRLMAAANPWCQCKKIKMLCRRKLHTCLNRAWKGLSELVWQVAGSQKLLNLWQLRCKKIWRWSRQSFSETIDHAVAMSVDILSWFLPKQQIYVWLTCSNFKTLEFVFHWVLRDLSFQRRRPKNWGHKCCVSRPYFVTQKCTLLHLKAHEKLEKKYFISFDHLEPYKKVIGQPLIFAAPPCRTKN